MDTPDPNMATTDRLSVKTPRKKRTPKEPAQAPQARKRAPVKSEGSISVPKPVEFSDQGLAKAMSDLVLTYFAGAKQPLNARIIKRAFHYAQRNVQTEFIWRKRHP